MEPTCTVAIEPSESWWTVRCHLLGVETRFQSGRDAEIEARRLAEDLAHPGAPAEIQIRLRDGSLARRFICARP